MRITKMLPLSDHKIDTLPYWRERILFSILFFGVLLGALNLLSVLPLVFKEHLWGLLIFDVSAWISWVMLLTLPDISFKIRTAITVLFIYSIGLFLTIYIGPLGGGPFWLFSFSLIAGILLGSRAAIFTVLVNIATIFVIGFLVATTDFGQSFPDFNHPTHMYVASVNFIILNALCSISVSILLKGLNRSHEKEQKLIGSLRESEKKYKHIYNNAPSGMYEYDFTKGKLVSVNRVMCSYTGYSEKELLSMNPLHIFTQESRKLIAEVVKKALAYEPISDNTEYNIINKDGKKLSAILSRDFIYKNKKLKRAQVVVHDITELKQEEKEKIKAQKIAGEQKKLSLVGQIAGKMAHDFNNILGIIMGNAELSILDCEDAAARKSFKLIFDQTIRGRNLTKNLVAFAKSNEPKQEFFKINDKIDLVVNLLKKDLQGIELIRENSSVAPDLLADPGMIEHAIVNLVQNSIHAVSRVENPLIIIRTFNLNDNVCFEIKDNGCGIPQKHIKKIFEPSFTLKGSNDIIDSYTSDIKGTGYGMSNVKKYIDQHKGTIAVKSELESGTKITVCLPVTEKKSINPEKRKLEKEKPYSCKHILIVEDEADIADVQYRVLTREPFNHRVDIAPDGQTAKKLFNSNRYDLVSLDYILEGAINGMDIYNYIREKEMTIPILFISGNIEFLESIKKLKQKDDNIDHISKPCQNKDYVNNINKLLNRPLQ